MSRTSAGVYSAPSNSFNTAVTGTSINPTDWNSLLTDLVSGLNSVPAITFVTGTASVTPAKFASGTLNSTPAAGALEYDGVTFYGSFGASQRGVLPPMQIATVVSGAKTALSNSSTGAQNIFASANDVLTVVASTSYRFRAHIMLNTGATSHTTSFGIALTTATLTSINYNAWSTSSAAATLATPQMVRVQTNAATALTAASTAATTDLVIEGIMRVNVAGSITPQVTFSAGPTGTCEVDVDSYFELWPIGSNTVAAVGNWG